MKFVVKIGGSLISSGRDIIEHLDKYSSVMAAKTGTEVKIVIVPGGGPFADVVRLHAKENAGISEDTAHWMAILAMNQYGLYLSDRMAKSKVIETFDRIKTGVFILLPYKILKELDPLPHSWKVTSDTIAAWVANQLDAEFIKATDVDGIYMDESLINEVLAEDLIGMSTCLDSELPGFLMAEKMNCFVVNGKYPERIVDVLEKKRFIGTVVFGSE